MAEIKKKIYTSKCSGQRVSETGEFVDFSDTLLGRVTPVTATKKLRKARNDQTITINHVEEHCEVYVMSLEEFIACALIKND